MIDFERAYFIKLGTGGGWAADSISHDIMRFGWPNIPLAEIHSGEWDAIRVRLKLEHSRQATVTVDTERLRDIVTSTSADVWITFHQSRLWWARVGTSPVEEDATSKFRRLAGPWSDCNIDGGVLLVNQIPGRIAQVQGFRGTVCAVHELDALRRLLNSQNSNSYETIAKHKAELALAVVVGIQSLHWKDFETLVDLIFRQAGWRRRSVLGETMKFADMELEEPITRDAYQVQVKSSADVSDFQTYISEFSSLNFRKLYFVVHTPTKSLAAFTAPDTAVLVLPGMLAEMVIDHGLLGWLADRVR